MVRSTFVAVSIALVTSLSPAQQVLWRIDAPPQGPFGQHLAVIR